MLKAYLLASVALFVLVQGSPMPSPEEYGPPDGCSLWYVVEEGDYCSDIADGCSLSLVSKEKSLGP